MCIYGGLFDNCLCVLFDFFLLPGHLQDLRRQFSSFQELDEEEGGGTELSSGPENKTPAGLAGLAAAADDRVPAWVAPARGELGKERWAERGLAPARAGRGASGRRSRCTGEGAPLPPLLRRGP